MTKLFKKLLKLIWWILFISFFVLFVFLWNSSSVDTNPLVFDLSERMRSRRWVLPIFPLIMTCLIFVNLFVDWPQKLSRWFRDVLGIIILASLSLFLAAQVSIKIDKYRNLIENENPQFIKGVVSNAQLLGGPRSDFQFEINGKKIYIEYENLPWSFPTACKKNCVIKDGMKLDVTRYGETVVRIIEY